MSQAVHLRDVRLRWDARHPWVLDLPELQLAAGERAFVAGPSGCGKSSLLALIAGIAKAQQGEVQVLGHDLGRLGGAARDRLRADHLGIIFQQFNLLPYLNVLDNVCLPLRLSPARGARVPGGHDAVRAEGNRLLDRLGLDDPALRQRPVHQLSVGQQQRVAAARALIGAPGLILADEPTSALDSDRRNDFIQLLSAECQASGAALLFVSHDRSLAPAFDRVIELPTLNRAAAA